MSAVTISLSGLHAAQTRLDAVAHNVANSSTENFHRQIVRQSEQPTGGVFASTRPSADVRNDLEGDMVEQLQAKNDFLVNAKVLKASFGMIGYLFDAKA